MCQLFCLFFALRVAASLRLGVVTDTSRFDTEIGATSQTSLDVGDLALALGKVRETAQYADNTCMDLVEKANIKDARFNYKGDDALELTELVKDVEDELARAKLKLEANNVNFDVVFPAPYDAHLWSQAGAIGNLKRLAWLAFKFDVLDYNGAPKAPSAGIGGVTLAHLQAMFAAVTRCAHDGQWAALVNQLNTAITRGLRARHAARDGYIKVVQDVLLSLESFHHLKSDAQIQSEGTKRQRDAWILSNYGEVKLLLQDAAEEIKLVRTRMDAAYSHAFLQTLQEFEDGRIAARYIRMPTVHELAGMCAVAVMQHVNQ